MVLKKIIFTDDDPDIRNLIHICLEDSGFTVETCESGEETLKKIPLFKPDLIILDKYMPGMGGIRTLKIIQEDKIYNSIPIVFLTAQSGKKEINTLLEYGAVDVIVKPFEPINFAAKIKEIWEQKIKSV